MPLSNAGLVAQVSTPHLHGLLDFSSVKAEFSVKNIQQECVNVGFTTIHVCYLSSDVNLRYTGHISIRSSSGSVEDESVQNQVLEVRLSMLQSADILLPPTSCRDPRLSRGRRKR